MPVGDRHRRRPEHRIRRQPDTVRAVFLIQCRDLVPAVDTRGVDDRLLRRWQDIPGLGEKQSLVVVGADDQRHRQQFARLRRRQWRLRQDVIADNRAVGYGRNDVGVLGVNNNRAPALCRSAADALVSNCRARSG